MCVYVYLYRKFRSVAVIWARTCDLKEFINGALTSSSTGRKVTRQGSQAQPRGHHLQQLPAEPEPASPSLARV